MELDEEYLAEQIAEAKKRTEKQQKIDAEREQARKDILNKYYYPLFPKEALEAVMKLKKLRTTVNLKMREIRAERKGSSDYEMHELMVNAEKTSPENMIKLNKLQSQRLLIDEQIHKIQDEYMTKKQLEELDALIFSTRGRAFQYD